MGFISKLFKRKHTPSKQADLPKECEEYYHLKQLLDSFFHADHYVAKSEYLTKMDGFEPTVDFFSVLKKSGTLKVYCEEHGLNEIEVSHTISCYESFISLIDAQNEQYISRELISEKDYLDSILRECDPNIILDDDQRRVVLTDEDYCLVVAGAGAGKTTTVAAKIKYLVDKQGIDPKKILVISFTNKAVNELKERINRDLKIDCPIATFHATGNAILRKQHPERLNIVEESKSFYVVRDYLKNSTMTNEQLVKNLILFFSTYFDAPYEGTDLNTFFNKIAKSNFSTMRSELTDFQRSVVDSRTKKAVTIRNEVLRSFQEVEIANFLFLNNIEYEYEPLYEYDIQFSRKPYTPDFVIKQGDRKAYIEHFGISESGRCNWLSQDALEAYKKAVNDKVRLHRQHGTTLIYTFSSFNDGRSLTEHLKEKLEEAGFVLERRPDKEVMQMLVSSEENRYIRKFVGLISRFISNFKVDGYTEDDFNRMYHSTRNERTRLFLNICHDCYLEYQKYLKENDAVDFQDMINDSARVLRDVKEMKQKLGFKYIIVDEYQDISRQRFDLVSALHEVCDAKIVAVGDDWQSIYAFNGSDIALFTKFEEKMGYAKMLKIVRTYRNSQESIDIAGGFVQKNPSQIKKQLVSSKHITDPVIIYTYDNSRKGYKDTNTTGANYNMAVAVETALCQIIAFNKQENKPVNSSVLVLGRYGFDGDLLEKSGRFEFNRSRDKLKSVKYPKMDITFMTAHASKGLGYDNVIVINGRNELFGFPSKIEDDPVLSLVLNDDKSIEYAEERRLFYVAMTRTKNRVFFIAPEQNPSEFLLEIKHDYKNVKLAGNWNENYEPTLRQTCPMCGYPMQFKYKRAYGLRLFICTNEPEACGFMTNELKAGKLSIIKCDSCRSGYLIVKPGKNDDYFLGCTNYKKDNTGCNRIMNKSYFYQLMGIKDPAPAASVVIPKGTDYKPDEGYSQVVAQPPEEEKEEVVKAVINSRKQIYIDLNETIYTILACLSEISKIHFFGITMLADVLRGSENKKIKSYKLNDSKYYGSLSNVDRNILVTIIEWMVDNRYIRKTKGLYPVLHPTYEGIHYRETVTTQKLVGLKKRIENRTEIEAEFQN